jgi:type I restriction enzyme S subunit
MTSGWSKITIEDCCLKVTSGGTPLRSKKEYYQNGTIPWVKTGELKDTRIYPDAVEEWITEEAVKNSSAKIFPSNTVLMAMYGDGKTIGSLGLLTEPSASNQACSALLFNPKVCDPIFLFYAMLLHREGLIRQAYGGAQRNLTAALIKSYKIDVPPLPIQQKIAGILSAYDDLIENNLKRIKLLEEMVRITYEEWFVRLRFPGHESIPVNTESGLPEGWEQKKLEDYFPIKTGKKDANIQTADGQYPFFTCSQGIYRTNIYSFDAEAIILAGNGEFNIKYYRGKFEAYQRNYVLIPHDRDFLFLLFLFMKHYLYQITAGSKGAVIKYLTKDMIADTKFQNPNKTILTAFNDIIVPIFYEIENLEEQNTHLREARDILLPRLMTGVIDVASYNPKQLLKEAK